MPTNAEFLRALFGGEAHRAHVTGFSWDPNEIPSEKHLQAWAGGAASTQPLSSDWNNYYTISLFRPDEQGKARRRKALFEATHVLVLDDVGEKLSDAYARLLPPPTYVLESSPGSEQWGYKLAVPESTRARVENLQDGLVASGLAPDGKDPGMKGVTRYVRLPDGRNTKQAKMLFGQPYKCRLTVWEPERTTTIEALAEPFGINIDAPRREERTDGASDLPDHPILGLDSIQVKEARGPGRFDIVCPWVDEHTGGADDGAAVFTNDDGSIGFKCHHGACEDRSAKDLLAFLEQENPGFRAEYKQWKVMRDFGAPDRQSAEPQIDNQPSPRDALQPVLDELIRAVPRSQDARDAAERALKHAEDLGALEQEDVHTRVRDVMDWSKQEFNQILKKLRGDWYEGSRGPDFLHNVMYVAELNMFYDWSKDMFLSIESFSNNYLHEDENVRTTALKNEAVYKVDKIDYAPGSPRIFNQGKIAYGNMYSGDDHIQGTQGDASPWLNHWSHMGWGEQTRDHMLKWMAFTLLHPERKINHFMILGSPQGSGKDFLLSPLHKALGKDATTIEGDALLETYTGFLRGTKYLHINEAELGDRREAAQVVNKLKPYAAAPPDTLRVREMYTAPFYVRNIVNGTFCTNSRLPLKLQDSRRFYAVWSDLRVRGADGNVTPEWNEYWQRMWHWMDNGGAEICVWYLRNCVDLSDFNPGEPPPVTEFMRDIQELSKPPVQKTLETAIHEEAQGFRSPLMTTDDILYGIKFLPTQGLLQTDSSNFTPFRVEMALREMGLHQVSVRHEHLRADLWMLQDEIVYKDMGNKDLAVEYLRRRANSEEENSTLTLIRNEG